jgi:hypothetical protein
MLGQTSQKKSIVNRVEPVRTLGVALAHLMEMAQAVVVKTGRHRRQSRGIGMKQGL